MSHVLILSIGPVQEFIAAARKTRDLWFGSQLLSDSAAAAARSLQTAGAELIFPAPDGLHAGSAPNKVMAIVDGDPAALANDAFAAAAAFLRTRRDQALRVAQQRGISDLLDPTLLDAQLDAFLERYAAWCPYDATRPETYSEVRRHTEVLLAGRKALRDFAPAAGRDGLPKSSLDGSRESVFRLPPAGSTREVAVQRLARADIKVGEALDGISLIKRLSDPKRFVSVSRIAVDPLLRRIEAQGRLDHVRVLAADLVAGGSLLITHFDPVAFPQYAAFPYDTQLVYDDGLDEETEEPDAKAAHFHQTFRAIAKKEPPTYLAVLAADGDRVGEALSALATPDTHRAFSRAGVAFAAQAAEIVTAQQGVLIYSGGDDVLAFLPIDTVLPCAEALRSAFEAALRDLPLPKKPTLSVGVAIGYYSEPLSTLLDWGRAAERFAKGRRNALAIALHTRSSGSAVTRARHSWDEDPLAQWEQWVAWYRDDLVPDGAAYELRSLGYELRRLLETGSEAAVSAMLRPEVSRILSRKRGRRGTRALEVADIARILPAAPNTTRESAVEAVERLEALVSLMIIARHVARVRALADVAVPEVSHGGY